MIRILRCFTWILMPLLAACATPVAHLPAGTPAAPAHAPAPSAPTSFASRGIGTASAPPSAPWGEATARDIARWYDDTRSDCGPGRPAYLCTGVMYRGQATLTTAFHSWNTSPASQTSGGVSFAYIRRDGKFDRSWLGVGFVLLPTMMTADGTEIMHTLCAFPIDGTTNGRDGRGCGTYPGFATSAPCENIANAQAWADYVGVPAGVVTYQGQCGFDVTDREGDEDARDFVIALQAKALLGATGRGVHMETRIATWNDDIGHRLPIAAFYYDPRNYLAVPEATVRDWAKVYQKDYYDRTGIAVPVIRLNFPPTESDDLEPVYEEASQAVHPPSVETLRTNVLEASLEGADPLSLAQLASSTRFHVGVPPYAGMSAGDRVALRIGAAPGMDTEPVDVHLTGVTSVPLPYEALIQATGQGLPIQAIVHRVDGRTEASAIHTVAIQAQPFTPTAPAYLDASDRLSIQWPQWQAGDRVRVFWGGTPEHQTDPIAVTPGKPLLLPVRQDWLRENLGRTVPVHYAVVDASGQIKAFSALVNVAVPSNDRLDAPLLAEGADNLIPPDAGGADIEIRVPDGKRGDEVAVTIDAPHPLEDTLLVRAAGEPVTLHLDRGWLESNRGADILVTYAVDRDGKRIGTSYPTVITVGTGP
ncbi:hypothetical protein [Luteibacter sp. CQ10]|uniref:hypothetical protein n=1 Tax=Luteibacter sp. CQ10 TaxID=2805821 RepID=UPI0034A1DB97